MNQNAEEKKIPEKSAFLIAYFDDNIDVEKEPIKPLNLIYWMSWLDYSGVWVQNNPLKKDQSIHCI